MKNTRWTLKMVILLVSSLTIMSVITISPAIPQMAAHFAEVKNADILVKLVLTLPAFLIAVCSPITGRIIDRYGRLRILWFSLVLYAVAGTAGFFLNNLYHILLSRAFLGIAVGMSMPIVITLIADYFEGQERQKFVGIQIAFMSLGGILFIGLGGILADSGWRYPFLIYLFSLVVLPLSILFLHEPVAGATNHLADIMPKSPGVIWLLFLNTMFLWIIFFLIPVQLPFYLKAIAIEKNSLIGAAIALSTAFSAVSSFLFTKLIDRFSALFIYSMGYGLMATGFALLAMADSYLMVLLAMMLTGLGMGMMIPNTNMWVMKIAPPEIRGKEMGKLTTFWFLGQFLSPVIIYPVVNNISLPATFRLAAGLLLLMSVGFLIPFLISSNKASPKFPAT